MFAALLLLACTPAPDDSDGVGSIAPPACDEPLALERIATFDAAALAGAGGIGYPDNRGPGLALADFTGDGWLDVWLASPVGYSALLVNDGAGNLAISTTATEGGRPLPVGSAAAAADLDGDGDIDLAIASERDYQDYLLYNEGGQLFRRVDLPDSQGETKTITLGDVDGDGDLDLFAAGFTRDPDPTRIEAGLQRGDGSWLWLQEADGTFVRGVGHLPEAAFDALTYHGAFVDADGDGDPDLYLSNDWGPFVTPNLLLLNDGTGHFTVADDCFCDLPMAGMGVAVGDSNGDAFPDLVLTDVGAPRLLGGTGEAWWFDAARASGFEVQRIEVGPSWGALFVDLDQDGWNEVAAAYGIILVSDDRPDEAGYERDLLMHGAGDGLYEDWSASLGFDRNDRGRAVVTGDLDRDGRPDLVTAGILYVDQWRTSGGCRPGVSLRVAGPPGNSEGIGATVTVEMPDRTYTRWVWPSGTYASSSPELALGLHGRLGADRITVVMPDGSSASAEDVAAGSRITLTPR